MSRSSGDAIVAAAATRHPLGVGMEVATLDAGVVIDEAAFHASERAALDELDPAASRARSRDALGPQDRPAPRGRPHRFHRAVAARALNSRRRRRRRRIVRSVPEFGSGWREVRFHDVQVPGNRAASVARLA